MTNKKWLSNFTILIICLNFLFIGLEFYKEEIRNQWMNGSIFPETAFLKLEQLTNFSDAIVFIYSTAILVIGIWLILKRNSDLQPFTLKNIRLLLYFFVLGIVLAIAFDTAIINLTQQLIGPVFILILLFLFHFFKNLLTKKFIAKH